MEDSESEQIFESLGVSPQLFINETLNSIDDLLDSAFDFYRQQASTILKSEGTDKGNDLNKGISKIRNLIQAALDKRMSMWEKYCLRHCFTLPEGFSIPKNGSSYRDPFNDHELDDELSTLRSRLAKVERESSALNKELEILEKRSFSRSKLLATTIGEVLELYEQSSTHAMFEELTGCASELRESIDKVRTRMREDDEGKRKVYIRDIDFHIEDSNGRVTCGCQSRGIIAGSLHSSVGLRAMGRPCGGVVSFTARFNMTGVGHGRPRSPKTR